MIRRASLASTVAASFLLNACSNSQPVACLPQAKIQIQKTSPTSDSDGEIFEKGMGVIVVLKDGCVANGPISSMVPGHFDGQTKAGVRSYEWTLPRAMTRKEMHILAEQDACVAMITESTEDHIDPSDTVDFAFTPVNQAVAQSFSGWNDPSISAQAHLTNIRAISAYGTFYDGKTGIGKNKEVVIAIVDSGVALSHEDLKANIWVNKKEIAKNGIDDDRNGYIDDVNGYNFASRIASPSPQVSTANSAWQWAHGSRVAGLAAAVSGNGRGGIGVMGTAKIMALNAMGTSAGFKQSDIANAVRYAADNGANVINLSLGGSSATADFKSALRYAVSRGVVILAAAGNDGAAIDSNFSAAGLAASLPGLISIANIKAADSKLSASSNYSTTYVELGAPGSNTASSGLYSTSPISNSSYGTFAGTSAAAPVAAGAAALVVGLLKSRGYSASPATVESLLLASARKMAGLAPYVKDGNALDLFNLASLINQRYPAGKATGDEGPEKPTDPSNGDPSQGPGKGDDSASQPIENQCTGLQ
jgi:hypothetical protein